MSHPDETARREHERDHATPDAPLASDKARCREVLRTFFTLGLTSFGGPIAHLGYFHDELVRRRGWLSDKAYAELVALCQFCRGRPAARSVSRWAWCVAVA